MNEDVFVDSDDFGFETGTTDGSGLVDMGDGLYVPTKDFKTIRLHLHVVFSRRGYLMLFHVKHTI